MKTQKFTFFFRKDSPFSNFYSCRFVVDEVEFNCMEQYMMYTKAIIFSDYDVAKKIMLQTSPLEMKNLGREVKNFDPKFWDRLKYKSVYVGIEAKFSQNEDLKKVMLATAGTTLVEASPYDKIWGCGLSEDNPLIQDRANWTGQNLLGQILTEYRDSL